MTPSRSRVRIEGLISISCTTLCTCPWENASASGSIIPWVALTDETRRLHLLTYPECGPATNESNELAIALASLGIPMNGTSKYHWFIFGDIKGVGFSATIRTNQKKIWKELGSLVCAVNLDEVFSSP